MPSCSSLGDQVIARCLKLYGTITLVPAPGALIEGGKLPLAVARGGVVLDISFKEPFLSLDLAEAGIDQGLSPSERVRRAACLLEGVEHSVQLVEEFNTQRLVRMKSDAIFSAIRVGTQMSLAELQVKGIANGDPEASLARVVEERKKAGDLLDTVFHLAPSKLVPGLSIPDRLPIIRPQLYNLLVPKGTQEREALDALCWFVDLDTGYSREMREADARRGRWWFAIANFFAGWTRRARSYQKDADGFKDTFLKHLKAMGINTELETA